MKPKVYLESSIISYLAARPAKDIVSAARQSITHDWWEFKRSGYDLYVSALVEEEISQGDSHAAKKRLEWISTLENIVISDSAALLAKELIAEGAVPKGSEEDALHIAIAATQGIDYLLTWNFKHINNAVMKKKIREMIEKKGILCSQICSPEELGGSDE